MEAITLGLIGASAIGAASNFAMQKYNEWKQDQENATAREREDNAVQRRVQDLISAGLSPTLAAGSAAEASGKNVSQMSDLDIAQTALSMAKGSADISQTNAQKELIDEQTNGQRISNAWQDAMNAVKISKDSAQTDNLRAGLSEILQNTSLLKAKTAFEQENVNYLKTLHDSAKITRDLQNIRLNREDSMLDSQIWNNYTSGNFGKFLFGSVQSLRDGLVDNLRRPKKDFWRNGVDQSWYWENQK